MLYDIWFNDYGHHVRLGTARTHAAAYCIARQWCDDNGVSLCPHKVWIAQR